MPVILLFSLHPSLQHFSVRNEYSAGLEVESMELVQLGLLMGTTWPFSDLTFSLPQNFSAAWTLAYPYVPLS